MTEEAEAAIEKAVMDKEEFINASLNPEEIEDLKKELKAMETQLWSAETASPAAVLSKLSATLAGLEETMVLADSSVLGTSPSGIRRSATRCPSRWWRRSRTICCCCRASSRRPTLRRCAC